MKQYDFYAFEHGFLLNVQSDILMDLTTCLVVPLMSLQISPKPAKRLNPVFKIDDQLYSMVTQYMASVACKDLSQTVGSLSHEHCTIKAALDMAFDGY